MPRQDDVLVSDDAYDLFEKARRAAEALDYDDQALEFYLIGAPSFITLKGYEVHKPAGSDVGHSYVQIVVDDAKCNYETDHTYNISIRATDGFLNIHKSFTLTVNNCPPSP